MDRVDEFVEVCELLQRHYTVLQARVACLGEKAVQSMRAVCEVQERPKAVQLQVNIQSENSMMERL